MGLDVIADYAHYEHLLAALQLTLAMFGMGLLLGPGDFVALARAPRVFCTGMAIQLLLIPPLASGLAWVLPVPEGIAAGIVLVACVPGGALTNVMTHFAAGNVPLSIALTTVTTLGSLLTTPLLAGIFLDAHLPDDFAMPAGRIAGEIALSLLLPLGVGMALGPRFGAARERASRLAVRASLVVILVMAIGAGASGRLDARAFGLGPLLALFALPLLLQAAGYLATAGQGIDFPSRLAIAIEVGLRNTNLALLLKSAIFPAQPGRPDPLGDAVFFTAMLLGGMQLLAVVVPVVAGTRRAAAARATEAAPG